MIVVSSVRFLFLMWTSSLLRQSLLQIFIHLWILRLEIEKILQKLVLGRPQA